MIRKCSLSTGRDKEALTHDLRVSIQIKELLPGSSSLKERVKIAASGVGLVSEWGTQSLLMKNICEE